MIPKRLARVPPDRKQCSHCLKELPKSADYFDRDKEKEDGFRNWCKQCRAEKRQKLQLVETAELMKKLDTATILNLAEAKPGGSCIPHAAEIYQNVMAIMGGVQGFAMHWAGTYLASKPGSQTRERMLSGMQKLSQAVSDSGKVQMPVELMSDDDLESELKRREERMRVISGSFTDKTDVKDAG